MHYLQLLIDSNVTTIIAALVLYFIGTGSVKGFAVTLMIGIVVSMFTAVVVTRTLMKWAVDMGMLKSNWQFRVKRGSDMFKVIEKTRFGFQYPKQLY